MSSLQTLNALLVEGDRAAAAGRPEEAIGIFTQVLSGAPGNALVLVRIAQAHFDLGRYRQAVDYYQSACAAKPGEARYWHNLGIACSRLGRVQEAEQAWRSAVAVDPSHVRSWVEIGKVREKAASLWEAERCYRQAIALQPGLADCLWGLMRVKLNRGEPHAALRWNAKALAVAGEERGRVYSNFLLTAHYHGRIGARGLARLGRLAARYYDAAAKPARSPARKRYRLAIGYLSPRLGDALTGNMLLALLPHHDRRKVEAYCYSTHRYDDAVAERLRHVADHWRDVETLDDEALADAIRADGIDVLIDLAGHCPGGRVGALCLRPAPVQISWFDYFDTMGLDCYDGIFSDPVATPPELARHYSERVLRLPACRLIFAPANDRPAPGALPARRNGHVRFGSFNRMAKISEPVLRLWARLLDAVPGSRLVLKNTSLNDPAEHDRHRARLAAAGIPVERVELLPASDRHGLWNDYMGIDIALDPFPFNGGITTYDALSMGVPVLALLGDSMVSRQSASIIMACGLDGWVVPDGDAYVAAAVDWCQRLDDLASLRAGLPARVARSPLCDLKGFTRALERLCYEAAGGERSTAVGAERVAKGI